MISFTQRGSWNNTEAFLLRAKQGDILTMLGKYGPMGAAALSSATPVRSGLTASSWTYEIVSRKGYFSVIWHNTNVNDGRPIAILIQYGHGTGTGGYVVGRDYIMPAIRPIFDQMANDAWREVTR